jgi:hypothetical protein
VIEYLSREDQEKLRGVLREIPELVENLASAIASADGYQSRISYQPRVSTGEKSQPLPYDPSASEASRHLHNELWRWVAWLAKERNLTQPSLDIVPMARWLTNNITTLATTPGAEPAYANIGSEIKAAKRASRRPTREHIHVDEIAGVRNQELNASGIAAVAKETGIDGLNRRRVHTLAEKGHVTAVRMYGKIPIYRLGDVLDAHDNVQQRQHAG